MFGSCISAAPGTEGGSENEKYHGHDGGAVGRRLPEFTAAALKLRRLAGFRRLTLSYKTGAALDIDRVWAGIAAGENKCDN